MLPVAMNNLRFLIFQPLIFSSEDLIYDTLAPKEH